MTTIPSAPDLPARPRPTSVLLLEPSGVLRDRLTWLLAEQAHRSTVTAVAQMPEALGQLRSDAFDVVLVELVFPGTEGLRALAELRRGAPGATMIALSGVPDPALRARSIELGADHFFHTIAEFEQVRDVVLGLVRRPEGGAGHE